MLCDLSVPSLSLSPNTHCQIWPTRSSEVSHRGTGVFCWMHRWHWANSASSCMWVSSVCNRNLSTIWIIWVVQCHVSPILYACLKGACTMRMVYLHVNTQCYTLNDVNFLFLYHNLLELFSSFANTRDTITSYTYTVFLHTKSMDVTSWTKLVASSNGRYLVLQDTNNKNILCYIYSPLSPYNTCSCLC